MVLPASTPDREPGEGWLAPLRAALTISPNPVLLRVENAVEARLGELVRGLLPVCPELDVVLSPQAVEKLPEGSAFVLVPTLRDAEWLNLKRPLFQRQRQRVILWCDAETTRGLPGLAPDFRDWISHSVPCPPPPSSEHQRYSLVEASQRLRQAGAQHPERLAALLDLERDRVEDALSLLRHGYRDAEILERNRTGAATAAGSSPAGAAPPSADGTRGAPKSASNHGASTAAQHVESPFVVGPPLALGAPCFVGRRQQIREIQASIGLGQPVMLLGEPRMGKTSLLNQVPQWLPSGMPWVLCSAQGQCGTSESELVRCLARGLGRDDIARAIGGTSDGTGNGTGNNASLGTGNGGSGGSDRSGSSGGRRNSGSDGEGSGFGLTAAEALEQLVPCALLLDEADALTKPHHHFSNGFFDQCRALGQQGRFLLVCAAHSDVSERLSSTGITSRFLNDSRRVWVGQLESEARDALLGLVPSLGAADRALALRYAGGFAMALQWMGEALLQRGGTGAAPEPASSMPEAVADRLYLDLDRHFLAWWQRRSALGQRLLRAAWAGLALRQLSDGERRRMRDLVARGLAQETEQGFTLPGEAWRCFVGER